MTPSQSRTYPYRESDNSESGKGYLLMRKSSRVLAALCVATLVTGLSGSAFGGEKPKKEKKPAATAKPAPATLEALEETIADLKAQLDELKAQVQKQQVPPNTTVAAVASIPPPASAPAPAPAPAAPQALTA